MLPSLALSIAKGSPRSRAASNMACIICRRYPRRRCVAITPVAVTPAILPCLSPGTVTSKEIIADAPTHVPSTNAAIGWKEPSSKSAAAHLSSCSALAGLRWEATAQGRHATRRPQAPSSATRSRTAMPGSTRPSHPGVAGGPQSPCRTLHPPPAQAINRITPQAPYVRACQPVAARSAGPW